MGYFASLARHTGIVPAARATSPVRGLEMDVTRNVEPPASAGSPALAPAARTPAPRESVIEIPMPPRLDVREPIVETERPFPLPDPEAAPAPPIAAVRVGPQDPARTPPRERRRPTLADVRAWVAQPTLEAAERGPVESSLRTPQTVRGPAASAPAIEQAENYTLEIGTIQIVMEAPPVTAQPQRPEPARTPAPSAPAWTHPSRYYLRP